MDAAFVRSLDALEVGPLLEVVERAEGRLFDLDLSGLSRSGSFEGAAPPLDLLVGQVNGPTDLASAIESVDPRWRLDVILALQDHLD
jgi:hypothetical protein